MNSGKNGTAPPTKPRRDKTKQRGKAVPNGPAAKSFIADDIDAYCTAHSGFETPEHHDIIKQALAFAPQTPAMSSDRMSGAVLRTLVTALQPLSILEVGTFVGYATLCMLEGTPDAKITCLDWDKRTVNMVQKRFGNSSYAPRWRIIHGDAYDSMQGELNQQQFDFVFIDADKVSYAKYVQWCYDHMPVGGVMVVDNALWHGRVLNPQSHHDMGVHNANQWIAAHPNLTNVLLPVRDGMHICVKTA